ncbi:CoA transferase [Pseudarthrobacter sulfonivorans]|uniref:CaiB/BaiF CoA transferase family protein n=1 Tax=Pseudarthrobacter sulfonivorans TaxID=121292 RepID=UPI00295E9CCE|nr:CoA transferase [Pseudarthrobacter sulfonivorans]
MSPDRSSAWPDDESTEGILKGLKVLDLSRVLAGPYCAQMMADHGASVLKVESPAGDETRQWGTLSDDGTTSSYYYGLNRSKRNIELDLTTPLGKEALRRLLDEADVVVENFKIGTMARWGFDYTHDLAPRRPELVYCRISGFGADGVMGEMPGYDAVLQAHGGLMSVNGYADRGPLRVGVPIVDIVAANLAFSGILLALQDRHRTGLGQFVDISLLDSVVSLLVPHSANWAMTGKTPRRTGGAHPAVAPYQTFDTPAGEFFIGTGNNRQFRSLMTVLGRPELADDEKFATNSDRIAHIDELAAIITDLVRARDLDVLARELSKVGVPSSAVKTVEEALTDAQVVHRELFIDDGDYRGVGVPIKLSRSKTRKPIPPAAKGTDTEAVLRSLGLLDPVGNDQSAAHTASVTENWADRGDERVATLI